MIHNNYRLLLNCIDNDIIGTQFFFFFKLKWLWEHEFFHQNKFSNIFIFLLSKLYFFYVETNKAEQNTLFLMK